MKRTFWTIAAAAFLCAACAAAQTAAAVVDGGQRAAIEKGGGGKASPVAVPAMAEGGSQRIVVEAENVPPAPPKPAVRRKVALVVQNHCVPLAGVPMMALTDALAAKLTGASLRVINPHNTFGFGQNTTMLGEEMPEEPAVDLARELGAEGIVTASVTEFLESSYGSGPDAYDFSARVTLNLADAGSGAGVCGASVKARTEKYTAKQVEANRLEYLGNLLHSAVEACAEKLLADPAIAEWEPEKSGARVRVVRLGGRGLHVAAADEAWQHLLERMRVAPLFREKYAAAQEGMGRRPIAIVGGLSDKTGEELGEVLAAVSDGIRATLGSSGLFDTKSDEMMAVFAERIVASGDSPLENDELMAALKQHGSPDFYVEGDLRSFPGVYRARLALHSLRDGKIVWEGIEEILK